VIIPSYGFCHCIQKPFSVGVVAASGTEAATTVLCTPDGGRDRCPKHVE